MIRCSKIALYVDGFWDCEFIDNPLQPGFLIQDKFGITNETEIAQIGMVIDNTQKDRDLFKINEGNNKNLAIDVNSYVKAEYRRIPFQNMIYIADGPGMFRVFRSLRVMEEKLMEYITQQGQMNLPRMIG